MKGVLLAGGNGTRLYPCTYVINKHLLPIYDKPMIMYPIQTMIKAGCTDLLIVTGGEHASSFMKLLKDGKNLGLNSILYAYQEKAGGIAEALYLAKSFIGQEKFMVMLGDNLLFDDLSIFVTDFLSSPEGTAKIFIKEIDNPSSFGVAEIKDGTIIDIIEKPKNPTSNNVVIGVYMYDNTVFDVIESLTPSARGEYEITDVNKYYLSKKSLLYNKLEQSEWLDTGTFESLFQAGAIISRRNNGNI